MKPKFTYAWHPKLPTLDLYDCGTVVLTAPNGQSLSTMLTADQALVLAQSLISIARAEIQDLKPSKACP